MAVRLSAGIAVIWPDLTCFDFIFAISSSHQFALCTSAPSICAPSFYVEITVVGFFFFFLQYQCNEFL